MSSAQEHPNGSSHSAAAEVHDKDFRHEEPVDSKSIDSARSTEDDEDDEVLTSFIMFHDHAIMTYNV